MKIVDSEVTFTWFVDLNDHKNGIITLPFTRNKGKNNVSAFVDWGDGNKNFEKGSQLSHEYDYSGLYEIRIRDIDCNAVNGVKSDLSGLLMVHGLESLSVTNFRSAFVHASDLFYVSGIPSDVTDMSSMFYNASSFNQPLSTWDTSSVRNMSYMFYNASSFNQSLNHWDVSNVTDMSATFVWAKSFNQPLDKWNVSNVKNMNNMFLGATEFNQPLNNWATNNVTSMSAMFHHSYRFNQNISDWDTSNIKHMSHMFACAQSFNQDISNWNVDQVDHWGNFKDNYSPLTDVNTPAKFR